MLKILDFAYISLKLCTQNTLKSIQVFTIISLPFLISLFLFCLNTTFALRNIIHVLWVMVLKIICYTAGDKDAENEVILLEHDVPHARFSEAVLACLPPDDWTIPEEVLTIF